VDIEHDQLTVFPHCTDPDDARFLLPKYAKLRSICLAGFGIDYDIPDDEDFGFLLDQLPDGFVRDPELGLGLDDALAGIISTVEGQGGFERLVIDGDGSGQRTRDSFVIPRDWFENWRASGNTAG
jgi:hypothetical protein